MTVSKPSVELVQGEPASLVKTRVLLGWLSDEEAAQFLMGRGAATEEEAQRPRNRLQQAREERQRRSPTEVTDPIVPPESRSVSQRLEAIAQRADIRASFAGMTWRPEMVDLRNVLSFQKAVATETLNDRVSSAGQLDGLFELCLPASSAPPPQGVISDPSGKGFTMSALNPNLRHAGSNISNAMVAPAPGMSPVPMQAITLFVNMGGSFLQVARYKGRCFIRDGYHRAVGLLRAKIPIVPCIFIEARSFEELSCPPGSLTYEVLYGERPPTIADFLDDGVSADGVQIAVRKVVRITVEEFIVPR